MPRNKTTNEKLKDERREQILHHALRLFVRKGLSATKMADIASASGISQGLAYHYFVSKEEIFTELIKEAYSRMTAAAQGLAESPLCPIEKIALAAEQLIRGFEQGESAALNFLLIIQASVFEAIPAEAKRITQGRSVLQDVIASIVRKGQQEGSFKMHDAQELALLFWSSLAGLAISKAALGDNFVAPNSSILVDMFIREKQLDKCLE